MADGSIIINTEIDNKKAQSELNKLTSKIERLNDKIKEQEAMKMPLVEQSAELGEKLDDARYKLQQMQNGDAGFFTEDSINNQAQLVKELENEVAKIDGKIQKIDDSIANNNVNIDLAKEKAGGYQKQLAAAAANAREINPALEEVNTRMDKFTKRITGLIKRVFVFSLITTALRGMRTWLSNVVKSNAESSKAIAQFKGALLTLAQPLVQVIIPAFITFVRVLTQVVSALASVVSGIFGTTAEASAAAAEALNDQTKALNGTGSAAKKAGKSLASFDEINKLSGDSGGGGGGGGASASGIAPDFSFLNETSDRMNGILEIVRLIGEGLLAWKIGKTLGLSLGEMVGLLIAIHGAIELVKNLMDVWNNGANLENVTGAIKGAVIMVSGLAIAFGRVGAGIGLVVAGVAMIVTGFRDMMKNGANLSNTLLTIAGIVLTGLGFTLLTGSIIPLVIAGIASVVLAVLALTGNFEEFVQNFKDNIIGGIKDIINGFINGDMEQVKQGVIKLVKGIANPVIIIVESLINAVIKGINWLIDKINSINFEVPDWVPAIGGKSLSPNIQHVKEWSIPRLAQGAVIPPNREFMAVLGDQKNGTNIETPLSTMVQAFKQAYAEIGGGSGNTTVVMEIDGQAFGRVVFNANKRETQRVGVSILEV